MCWVSSQIEKHTNFYTTLTEIDKKFLHRVNSSEVFLLQCFQEENNKYIAKSIIPKNHQYFADHYETETLDFIFLLECARQAETYIAHAYYNIPLSSKFILNSWSFKNIKNHYLSSHNNELLMEVVISETKKIKEIVYKQNYAVNIYSNKKLICHIQMNVSYVPNEKYQKIRPNSDLGISNFNIIKSSTRNINNIVSPHLLSMTRNENVVISCPDFSNETLSALLNVDFNNISFFDHQQDHYPAMLLMEAGRQMCALYFNTTQKTCLLNPRNIQSTFFNYTEFDSKVNIFARKKINDINQIDIEFIQQEKLTARLNFLF
ncbi:hypothetical protein B6D12_12745 [Gilliamella apicola]|nr:hypothetical protein B5S41_12330 [Gilliamella apicola]OTP92354.1 hypothetical protein B6D13_12835 [Gilliamella apicola]OTP98758.1 hypothetical protein B6D07_12795 [Gilliamella apicola]OTQ03872.1 hypothetical protein B6D12_12745 [Gilliamella apicola]